MKKGIYCALLMSFLLLGFIPSVNQNVIHLYTEQINQLPNLSGSPNEERAPIEEGSEYLEQPALTPPSGRKITDYIEGTRIEILNDEDFGPANYNFPGLGIQSDPYIIDGYSIEDTTGTALINIQDTSEYFHITNCSLNGHNRVKGISLINVTHGTITNNRIVESTTGISLHASALNKINKNVILNSTTYGIALTALNTDNCKDNLITQNSIFNASTAINFGSGSSQLVNNNSVTWNNFFHSRDPYFGHSVDTGINNSFQNNHWDDWTGPDVNSDGFVDMPYNVNQPQSCLRFPDASNTRARFSPSFDPAVPVPGNDVTIELWVNPTDLTTGKTFISKNYQIGSVIHNLFLLGYYNDALEVHLDGSIVISVPSGEAYGWQHFAVTLQQKPVLTETNITLYRNGQKLDSSITNKLLGDTSSSRPGITSIRPWYIGSEYDTDYALTDYFEGQIDEVRIVNRSLTPTEIYQDYASSIPFDYITNGYFNSRNHYPIRQDTLYHAHLDEQSGTTVYDSSDYETLGEVAGSFIWDVDQHAGLNFDGSNDYGNLADFTLNDVFTIELWINPLDTTSSHCILGKHNNAGTVNIFLLFIAGGNLWIYDSTNQATPYNLGTISTGWQHLAVIVSEGPNVSYQCFRDGNYIGSFVSIGAVNLGPTDKLWTVGQDWDSASASDFFWGSMRGIRFINRSLTAQEIYEDYAYPNTAYPDRTDTVAWYHLTNQTDVVGRNLMDYSGNGYNGSIAAGGFVDPSQSWKQGTLNFDPSPRVAPIWINDNEDFASFSSSGNGTVETPFILEDYYLISDTTPLVQIYNTTAHFVLQKSFLDGMYMLGLEAIILRNVSNGLIRNNYIAHFDGIKIYDTHFTTFSSNELIKLSPNEGNEFIYADSSHNNTFEHNTLESGWDGIQLISCFNNTFYGNTIRGTNTAIRFSQSDYNQINWNKFIENGYGIFLSSYSSSSDNNVVQWNYFINNSNPNSQAYDAGVNNIFSYNHYNEHTSPDITPADGIVDTPYDIYGGSNQDLFPRAMVGPIVNITSPIALTYNEPKINISLTGNAIQYKYYIEGIDIQNQTWTQNTNRTIPDGTYTLHVYGTDPAGYITQDEVSFTIEFFEIISPLEQEYGSPPITISFSGYAVHYWYYIDGEDLENQTWTSNIDRTFLAGSYTLHAYGNDSEGNIGHQLVNFTVETTPPVINLISPQSVTYFQNTIELIFTITDYDSYTIYLDGTVIPVPSGTTIQFPGVEDEGSHNITIIAVDQVGNIAQTTIIFSIYIPPTLNIDSPLQTSYATGSITITLSGDALHYWYYIADIDSTNQTWTMDVSRTLPAGVYTLHAYGNASNGAIAHQNVTFTIDMTSSTTTSLSTTTTTLPTSTTTSKSGTFPGFISVLLSFLPLIIFVRKQRN